MGGRARRSVSIEVLLAPPTPLADPQTLTGRAEDAARTLVYGAQMPLARALVTWHNPAEPFKHACSNTLYFETSPFSIGGWDSLAEDIAELYRTTGTSTTIKVYPNGWGLNVRMYDMSDAKPRPIKAEFTVEPGPIDSTGPREVALCLSYYADRNLPRQRGRIYLGPFAPGALNGPRPSMALMEVVRSLGNGLAEIGGEDVSWRIYSPTADENHHIRHIWVNDEWDTIRARQLDETQRITANV